MSNTGVRPRVSIIVPMYNTEAFVCQCVESLRKQSLADIEVILVDDGSPDGCGEMADGYAQIDDRVKVIHRPNGGLGPARNSGIDAASGEYVGFVDSDDWIKPDMYESLYSAASTWHADMAFTGLTTVAHGKIIEVRRQPLAGRVLFGAADAYRMRGTCYGALPCKLKDDPTPVSAYTGIYRLDFLREHNLRFRNVRSEDRVFNIEASREARVIACVDGAPYCYRKDDQPSITKTMGPKTVESFFQIFILLEQMAAEEPACFRDESKMRVKRFIVDGSRSLIRMIEDSTENRSEKQKAVSRTVNNPILRNAMKRYPFWRLPVAQTAFFFALKTKCVPLVRLFANARRRTAQIA